MSWPKVKLGDLITTDRSGASLRRDEFTDSGIIVVPKKAISDKIDIQKETFVFTSEEIYLSNPNNHVSSDFLITTLRNLNPNGATLGLVCRHDVENEIMLAQGMYAFKLSGKIDPNYLCYISRTQAFRNSIKKRTVGSTQVHIRAREFKDIEIELPPLEEQKRISAILDKADEIKKSSIKIQDSKMLMIQSVFVEMFGDPIANRRNWDTITIKELTTRITKGESPKWQGFDYQEKGIRFITSENVLWGELDLEKVKWIPEEFHDKLARSKLTNEDVLINLVGASVGRTTLVCLEALPANINQAVAVVSLDSFQCKPVFLVNQLLIESMQRRLLRSAVHSARANISLTNIRELQIILPPIELQIKFENTLKIIDKMFNSIANGSKTANLLALSSTELLVNQ